MALKKGVAELREQVREEDLRSQLVDLGTSFVEWRDPETGQVAVEHFTLNPNYPETRGCP